MVKISLILIVIVGLAGCCKKKDCDLTFLPAIMIVPEGFTEQELENYRVYYYTKGDNILFDSSRQRSILIDRSNLTWYVVKIDARADTIDNIHFDIVSNKIKCNSCFPPGIKDGDAIQERYENFGYRLNGKEVDDSLTVVISK